MVARSLTLVEDLGVVEHLELLGGVLARIHERCLDSARVVAEEVGEVVDLGGCASRYGGRCGVGRHRGLSVRERAKVSGRDMCVVGLQDERAMMRRGGTNV